MPEGTGTRLIKATRKSTKPIGREPHKKSGIDDLNHRGFCVLTSFSSKVSPGRFPETSTFYGRGRREGFGEPPGGNAISCRAAAVECTARPGRTGGPAGPWRDASAPAERAPFFRSPRAANRGRDRDQINPSEWRIDTTTYAQGGYPKNQPALLAATN